MNHFLPFCDDFHQYKFSFRDWTFYSVVTKELKLYKQGKTNENLSDN